MNQRADFAGDVPRMSSKDFVFAAGAVILLLAGCAGPKITLQRAPQVDEYRVSSIAVLPFQTVTTPQVVRQEGSDLLTPPEVVKSDISMAVPEGGRRFGHATSSVPPGTGMKVARIITTKLRAREGLAIVPPWDVESAVAALQAREPGLPAQEVARRMALKFKTDAAVTGLIRVYKEREGSRYGAVAAIVGFEVKLVATDGRVLWTGNYYEEQRPVTEDIFGFFARGFGFVTAEDLADYGAERLVKEFPFGT